MIQGRHCITKQYPRQHLYEHYMSLPSCRLLDGNSTMHNTFWKGMVANETTSSEEVSMVTILVEKLLCILIIDSSITVCTPMVTLMVFGTR